MAAIVKHAKFETRTARARLKRGRQAHWRAIIKRTHLGYQRWPDESDGRWILRHFIGSALKGGKHFYSKYRTIALGRADDAEQADGRRILSFEQAEAAARAMVDAPQNKVHRMTVRQALDRYVEFKVSQGQSVSDLLSRARAHILPVLGSFVVEELTAEQLRRWLATMASMPAQVRPKAGKPQYQPAPETDEDIRRRRATANRVLTMLKAALNHAFDEGLVASRDAWGRRLKPYRDVEVARVRFLSIEEARRLINACDPEFRPMVRAALETGARYSELTRMEVSDFNPDAGTLAVRKSKTGKARHIVLTEEGIAFLRGFCAGRAGHELMFTHSDGSGWKASEQGRPMAEASERAKLKAVTFHILRHSWASASAMAGVPLTVIAANLGHAAGSPVTAKHYAHLAPSHVRDAIRAGAPKYGIASDTSVVPLRKRK